MTPDEGISESERIKAWMQLEGLAKTVKYYSIKMSATEIKLYHELIENQIGYIQDDLNSYERCRRERVELKETIHQEMNRLQDQLAVLRIMERDLRGIMETLQKEELQEELR